MEERFVIILKLKATVEEPMAELEIAEMLRNELDGNSIVGNVDELEIDVTKISGDFSPTYNDEGYIPKG